eukprot:3162457-Prymnesium_polylepis.2
MMRHCGVAFSSCNVSSSWVDSEENFAREPDERCARKKATSTNALTPSPEKRANSAGGGWKPVKCFTGSRFTGQ